MHYGYICETRARVHVSKITITKTSTLTNSAAKYMTILAVKIANSHEGREAELM